MTEKDFNAAYDSMTVATNLQRAEEATQRYNVASVPLMIVNGKYSTERQRWPAAQGPAAESLINDLAASEKKR